MKSALLLSLLVLSLGGCTTYDYNVAQPSEEQCRQQFRQAQREAVMGVPQNAGRTQPQAGCLSRAP